MQYCIPWQRRNNRIIPGIYCIRNTLTQDCYVGASENLRRRYLSHSSRLRDGIHQNKRLQASYLDYGADAFVFELLEECDFDSLQLDEREEFWIDQLYPKFNRHRSYAGKYRPGHARSNRSATAKNHMLRHRSRKLDDKEDAIMTLAQEKKQVLDGESAIALLLRQREGGDLEVPLPIGRADLVTDEYVIEIKHVSKWLDALKVIAYASYIPGRKPRVHLFGMYPESMKPQILETMKRVGVEVTFENASLEKIAATPLGEKVED